jgi:cell division initiation protein
MTPLEIKNHQFKRSMWGYAPNEVAELLDNTAKLVEKLQKQEKDLQDKIKGLHEELNKWRHRESELLRMKEKGQQEVDAIREQAQQEAQKLFREVEEKANGIRTKTEEWLADVIARVEETERQKQNFMNAFKAALDSHYELLRTEQVDGEPLGDQLNHFLKNATSGAPMSGN